MLGVSKKDWKLVFGCLLVSIRKERDKHYRNNTKLILVFLYSFVFLFRMPNQIFLYIEFIIIFLHELGRLTCSGIDTLSSFPRAPAIPSSPGFVGECVFRETGVVHSFEVVDPVLFVFESHVLYSRDLRNYDKGPQRPPSDR